MGQSSANGKQHTKSVYEAMKNLLNNESIATYKEPVQQTALYIVEKYPTIEMVHSKYDFPKPDDEPDLKLTLKNDEVININLFSLKSANGKIQPKNLGAKSFIAKYFDSMHVQELFNEVIKKDYRDYLESIIETKEEFNTYDTVTLLKKKVGILYPDFTDEINPIRTSFLYSLREQLFDLLQQAKPTIATGLVSGFKELMLVDSINIVTRYNDKNKCSVVEEWNPQVQLEEDIQLYKKGNETIGIRMGQSAVTIRLKFESKPISSLKLATSFDEFPVGNERQKINERSLNNFMKTLKNHHALVTTNDKNAIGKCNEALIYAAFIESHPNIYQIDEQEYSVMFETYSPKVKEQTLGDLKNAALTAVTVIEQYLNKKYEKYGLESIQLVPQSYIKNRLDTADIQVSINYKGKIMLEDFSLKATAKRGTWITIKNPGAGTILGPSYFGVGSLIADTERVKAIFLKGELTHKKSIAEISKALGTQLQSASQPNLKKGLEALLGKAVTIVTFYSQNSSIYYEHNQIDTTIEVYPQTPTDINTFLKWNAGEESLKLRVKFSGGQHKGWSSIKLACEYRVG